MRYLIILATLTLSLNCLSNDKMNCKKIETEGYLSKLIYMIKCESNETVCYIMGNSISCHSKDKE